MRTLLLTLLLGPILIAPAAAAEPPPAAGQAAVMVATTAGQLRGMRSGGVEIFKGIPYAAAPIGPLRWRPPQPVHPWSGVRDAVQYGNDCMQNRFPYDSTPSQQPMSEDCLNLNVWAPEPAGSLHPVMVWIHGGALTTGSGSSPVFDGTAFARKGVVLVTINYRLGRFGFFVHPALLAQHPDEPFGNYGLMDQIAALEWVHANIASFGGDPANVTVFGQSSGGASVLHLMASPPARGLFAKAIAESGGGREPWARLRRPVWGKAAALQAGIAFANSVRIQGRGKAAARALRALPAAKVLGNIGFFQAETPTYAGPMVDGRIVPRDLTEAFREREQARVPLLTGTTDDELGALPVGALQAMTAAVLPRFGARQSGLGEFYGPGKSRPEDLLDDAGFVEPARYLARLQAATGAPVWLYRFGYVASAKRTPGHGAGHASELPYVFGTLNATTPNASAPDRAMSSLIQDYWIAFARTGDPNGGHRPLWPRYGTPSGRLMMFHDTGSTAQADPLKVRLDYITQSYPPDER